MKPNLNEKFIIEVHSREEFLKAEQYMFSIGIDWPANLNNSPKKSLLDGRYERLWGEIKDFNIILIHTTYRINEMYYAYYEELEKVKCIEEIDKVYTVKKLFNSSNMELEWLWKLN